MMTARISFTLVLCALTGEAHARSETFDAYASGTQMHHVDDWKGLGDSLAQGALTSSDFSLSGQHSLDIVGSPTAYLSDLVQTFSEKSGQWLIAAWQYIPSSTSGSETSFSLMNKYHDHGAKNWSTRLKFDLDNGLVYDDLGSATGSLPLVRDQWVPIIVNIDLDQNFQTVYYNGQKLLSAPWVRMSGGASALAAIELNGGSASHTYYDDISLTSVPESASVALAWAAGLTAFPRRRNHRM